MVLEHNIGITSDLILWCLGLTVSPWFDLDFLAASNGGFKLLGESLMSCFADQHEEAVRCERCTSLAPLRPAAVLTYSFDSDVPVPGIVSIDSHFPSCPLEMLQLQTTLACPKPESPVSPRIFFTSSNGSEDEDDEGSTAQATVTTVLDPHRRSPPPGHRPVLRTIRSTEEEHVLSVHLPGFTPEMVTVSARKDDRLAVVADLWHAEANCESPIYREIRGCGAAPSLSVAPKCTYVY